MPFVDPSVALRTSDGRDWTLLERVVYRGASETFVIPGGYASDLATVPAVMRWLIPPAGRYILPVILHDYLITNCLPPEPRPFNPALPFAAPETLHERFVPSTDVDGIFRRAMREADVPPVLRWLMWTGVRWGALFNARRRPGWAASAPLVLLWSLPALVVALPGALGALWGLLTYALAEGLTAYVADLRYLVASLWDGVRHWASDPTDPWSHDHATCPRCQGTPEASYYRRHGSEERSGQGPLEEHAEQGDARGQADQGERGEEAGPEAEGLSCPRCEAADADVLWVTGAERVWLVCRVCHAVWSEQES